MITCALADINVFSGAVAGEPSDINLFALSYLFTFVLLSRLLVSGEP
jgi:hypothetical protein